MKTKVRISSLCLILSLLIPQIASADDGKDWIIRARGVYVKTDSHSRVSTLGGSVATTSDRVPELDFTRFFTKNIAS